MFNAVGRNGQNRSHAIAGSISLGKAGSKPAVKKFASAYRLSDGVMLHSQLVTPFGNFEAEPFRVLPREAGAESVGAAIREVLEASREAPDTPHRKEFAKQYLNQLGVKSHAALQRGAILVGMVMAEGKIKFAPTHNGGTTGDGKGFVPSENRVVSVMADAPAEQVATALQEAFELCTSVYA